MKKSFFLITFLFFFLLISFSSIELVNTRLARNDLNKLEPGLRKFATSNSREDVRVVVWFKEKPSSRVLSNVKTIHRFETIPAIAMYANSEELKEIESMPNVDRIVRDRIVTTFRDQSLTLIRANNTLGLGYNGTGVNVSIVDTGVFNHTEFQSPNRIISEKCYCSLGNCCPDGTSEDDNATDDNNHGTHCAGIAVGNLGIANGSSIIAVKTLNSAGVGYDSDVALGIEWSFLNGSAHIISISSGVCVNSSDPVNCYAECYESPVSVMVDNAVGNGTLVVVSTGNCGPTNPSGNCREWGTYTIAAPACAKKAIAVGAVSNNDVIAGFSSQGPTDNDNRTKPDIVAPGVDINSTSNSENGYVEKDGTSQSAPHIAGVAALVIEKFNEINGYFPDPDRVKTILLTAVNTTIMTSAGYPQRNNIYGSGRIDAVEALNIINYTENDTLTENSEVSYKINVTSNDFKTTLYWPEDNNTNNNLDLTVGNRTHNFSYSTSPNDTVEQVFISDAVSGFWNVFIKGVNVSGSQDYFLASNMEVLTDSTAPLLTLEKPENRTYTTFTDFTLNFTTDETNHTIWYTLDGGNEINITGNTTFNVSTEGPHKITLYVNDSIDNINQSTKFFVINVNDPLYFDNSTNSTIAGIEIEFRLRWSDNVSLAGYIFSFDNGTNTFTNDTWQSIIGSGNWSNVTKFVNSTIGTRIQWIVYANDTGNNWNKSDTYSFTTTGDITKPAWSGNISRPTYPAYSPTQTYFFNVSWSDNVAIHTVFIEHNFTGSSTPHNMSFTGNESQTYYFNVTALPVKTFVWKSYANDTSNNWNSTDQFIYTIPKAASDVALYLNRTRDDVSYSINNYANFTAVLNISGKNVNLTTNMTGWSEIRNTTTITNYTYLTSAAVYNITGYWNGDENYTSDAETWYATVSGGGETTTTASGGNGGNGNGGTSNLTRVSHTFSVLNPDIVSIWKLNQPKIPIVEFQIKVKNTLNNVKLTVESSDSKFNQISVDASGEVYKYIQINKSGISDEDIESVLFNFTVNKTWISGSDVDKDTITLNRYSDGRWYTLTTNSIKDDDDYYYFKVETTGLSFFAITGESEITTTTTAVTTTSGTTTVEGGDLEEVSTTYIEEKSALSKYWYSIPITIAVASGSVFFGLWISKKKSE